MDKRNEIDDIVVALYHVKIAVESLNPDPLQTIGDYRKSQKHSKTMLVVSNVVSAVALIVSIVALFIKSN
jgi:hypothetical protein